MEKEKAGHCRFSCEREREVRNWKRVRSEKAGRAVVLLSRVSREIDYTEVRIPRSGGAKS